MAEATMKHADQWTEKIVGLEFDPTAVVPELVPPVVTENGGGVHELKQKVAEREIVLGRNVHTSCLAVTEPEASDEFTGDKEAYMAGVLARYRKTLMERTKHHLGKILNCPQILDKRCRFVVHVVILFIN